MTDQTKQQAVMQATPEHCFEVVSDFDSYMQWANDLKEVKVIERDEQGRATKVSFRAAAFGRSSNYTLAYDYSDAPTALSWTQIDGDLTSRLDGAYNFEQASNGDTNVTYSLEVELKLPIPGFVKRRTEFRIIGIALKNLKVRVESS